MLLLLLLYSTAAAVSAIDPHSLSPLSEELIRYVNEQPGARWNAVNYSRFRTVEDIRSSLGAFLEPEDVNRIGRQTVHHEVRDNELPDSFDARDKWPHCAASIGKVRDQSNCEACWAFGPTGAMSDRICIASGGKVNVELSAIDVVSCCKECGDGCEGGRAVLAWDYWASNGVVTGSSMEEGTGCKPYPFPMCAHFGQGTQPSCEKKPHKTPKCVHTCQKGYPIPYKSDKHYGLPAYYLTGNERQIRKEIMTSGPVTAKFTMYADFFNYKSGIYHHVAGEKVGVHTVKLIGWGVENKTPYWLAVNSWNAEWGENGLFRIYRGANECGIEQLVTAALPKI